MKKIIVTGSDGFIGSHITEELLNNNYFVIGIDNHSKYKIPCKKHYNNKNFKIINYDLRKSKSRNIEWILENYSEATVIHCAASIGGIEYFHKNAGDLIIDNALIDSNIIRNCSKFKLRLIALSSSMVYENTNIFPTPENCLSKIPPPTSTYGFSKLSMEYMIKGANEQYGLPYTILRPFNAIGIGENDFIEGKTSHVLPDLVVKTLKEFNRKTNDGTIELYGNGQQTRCFTNARDIARAVRMSLESDKAINEDFNISIPVETKICDLSYKIFYKIYPITSNFNIKSTSALKYDVQRRIPDTSKAKKLLGFEAKISLDESIDEVIEYIRGKLNV